MQAAVERQLCVDYAGKFTIGDLCRFLEDRIPCGEIQVVNRAYQLAERAHRGQTRRSGEPYIFHPLAVAKTIAGMNMDYRSIAAAILHDVLEDTEVNREEIVEQFDQEIFVLVDGLSKMTHLKFESRAEAQAANFRKMLLAIVNDTRVILIKLADRLHNMETIGSMSVEKQRRIARETLDIYAPIANRLGIVQIKNRLEELSFKALYPSRHRVLEEAVRKTRSNRKALVQKIEQKIMSHLEESGITSQVSGREKHLYSLYQKMRTRQLSFQEVFDMFAVQAVVENIDDCYRTLGKLHNLYKPIPGHFKDHIAIPKANGYQSLHTLLFTDHGVPVEVQIRSGEMDRFAESGIAAHWIYQTSEGTNAQTKARQWLSTLVDMGKKTDNSQEFMDSVKVDLFPDEIYVFSPKGDILQLPTASTVVDFAYAIHSDIGNTCVTAKIDRRLASLSTHLSSGQTVEIITSSQAKPSPLWLNFVATAKARTAIRSYLKNLASEEASGFGRRLIDRALSRYTTSLTGIDEAKLQALIKEFGFNSREELFIDVGLGNRLPSLIASRLMGKGSTDGASPRPSKADISPILIEGSGEVAMSLALCCMPIPGDNVQGFLASGKGVVVHRASCRNVSNYRRRPREWVPVEWSSDYSGVYQTNTIIELRNKPGTLARVTSTLSQINSNIENIRFATLGESLVRIVLTLSVRDRKHMARIIRRLRNLPTVERIKREVH